MNRNDRTDRPRHRVGHLVALLLTSTILLTVAAPAVASGEDAQCQQAPAQVGTSGASADGSAPVSPEQALINDAKSSALDFLESGASMAGEQLSGELDKVPGKQVVLELGDVAGAAFGVPGVGSMLGAYINAFGGLLGGGGGDATSAAIAKLDGRTSCLEANAKMLTNAVSALAKAQAQNENKDRVGALQLRIAGLRDLERDATEFDKRGDTWKKKFFADLADEANQFVPPISDHNIWGWRGLKVTAGTSANQFAPIWELDQEQDVWNLSLETYMRMLVLVARFRDSLPEDTIKRHVAFLVGDGDDLYNFDIKWPNGRRSSLLDRFFPVQCDERGQVVTCSRNGIVEEASAQDFATVYQTSAGQMMGTPTTEWMEAQLKAKVLAQSGPVPNAIIAAANALTYKPPQTSYAFDTSHEVVGSNTIYAVDSSGKMHAFKHMIEKVDLWKQKSGSKSPSDIAKVIGAGPLSVGKLGTVSAPDDSDADMSSPPPGGGGSGGISKTSVGALQSGPHSNVLSPAAHMDKVIGQIDTSQLPVSRYELRNDLVEYDAVPGDWSKVEDIIPAQLSSSGQIVYAENPDGRIWWRRLGLKAPPPSPAAGTGWTTVKNVFSGGEGVLYAVNSDGQLVWYRNATVLAGYDQAASWQQHPVGVGWGEFTRIFSPGKGIIYAVKPDGSLWWYKHYGYLAGSPSTQVGSWSAGKQVGTGWGGFTKVFAAPLGYIYAINGNGELLVYHHLGWENGEVKWEGPTKLADGWDKYRIVFPAMGGSEADGSAPLIVK